MKQVKTIKRTPFKKLRPLLEKIFGKEHVNRYTTDMIPTVLLVDRGVFNQDVTWLKQSGWIIAGLHPMYHEKTKTKYLQVGLREAFDNE